MKIKPSFLPVVLREMRQFVRARTILAGLVAAPILMHVVTWLSVSSAQARLSPSEIAAGPGLGMGPLKGFSCLAFLICAGAIPFFTAAKASRETSRETTGLEFITSLTPADYAAGKIVAGALLMLAVVGMTSPFIAFCYALRGVPPSAIAVFPAFSFCAGLVNLSALLAFATSPVAKGLRNAAFVVFLMIVPIVAVAFVLEGGVEELVDSVPGPFLIAATALAVVFAGALTASHVSPRFTDRDRPIRLAEAACAALAAATAAAFFTFGDDPGEHRLETAYMASCLILICLSVAVGVRAAFAPERITRALRLRIARRERLWPLRTVVMTGSAPGVVFSLLLFLVGVSLAMLYHKTDAASLRRMFALFGEFVGLAVIVGAVLREKGARVRGMRLGFVLFVVAAILVQVFGAMYSPMDGLLCLPLNLEGISKDLPLAIHMVYAFLFGVVATVIVCRDYALGIREARGGRRA